MVWGKVVENAALIHSRAIEGRWILPKSTLAAARLAEADRTHRFWPDNVNLLAENTWVWDRVLGHRQMTDAYLLALAVRQEGRLVTFDR